jgi:hypothetical protein
MLIWFRLSWADFFNYYLTSHIVRAITQLCETVVSWNYLREVLRWPHRKIRIV